MSKPVKTLYTTSDVKEVRKLLLQEQNGLDALTGLPIASGKDVLDHCHDSQYVRAVLDRQTNAVLGKIENLETRYLSWWYPYPLSTFLRQAADYLEKQHVKQYIHPKWQKKILTQFNKLKSSEKDEVLCRMDGEESKNDAERRKQFKSKILTRLYDYDTITNYINESKEVYET